jgi:hypothetical protein
MGDDAATVHEAWHDYHTILTTNESPFIHYMLEHQKGDSGTRCQDCWRSLIDPAKLLRLKDLNDYMPVQQGFQRLRDIAREFSRVHVQALVHSKKVETSDPFDQILGSTALRGEPDTNIVIFQQNGERFIMSETRVGRALPATQLTAELVTSAGADVVNNSYLGPPLSEWQSEKQDKAAKRETATYEHRVVEYLQTCNGMQALQQDVLKNVTGKTGRVLGAISKLTGEGAVIAEGTPRTITLQDGATLELYLLVHP